MTFALQDRVIYSKDSLQDVIQQNLNANVANSITQSDLEKVLPLTQAGELAALYRNYKAANTGSSRIFLRFLVEFSIFFFYLYYFYLISIIPIFRSNILTILYQIK